jgi:ComF family protein
LRAAKPGLAANNLLVRLIDALRWLDDEIMPRSCAFCGDRCIEGELAVCGGCRQDLPRNDVDADDAPFTSVVTPLSYEFPVDAAIKALKFGRKLHYVPAFGELLCDVLDELPGDVDALLPVPLHWFRHISRGFNQSAELCKPLRRASGLPVLRIARRTRATPYQSGLNADQRRRNLEDAFSITSSLGSRHIVIVDDVITTGTTARALANVLFEAGADKVSVIAIARA